MKDYALRLTLFDVHAATQSRVSRPLDESGLSLNTATGLPLALDRQSRSVEQFLPVDLFENLTTPRPPCEGSQTRLNPAAEVWYRDIAAADRIEPIYEPLRPLDYRFGLITIEYQNMKPGVAGQAASEAVAKGSIDAGFGVIHLYRDADDTQHADRGGCTILGVLAIPSIMSISEFLVFVQPGSESISEIRMIRDALPNRCMALLKFRTAEDATLFREEYDGKPFWAMLDDEICHIVCIRQVQITTDTSPPFVFPMDSRVPTSCGLSHAIELPHCPVCLERMDSAVTGLATIICGHQFHCNCLSKWPGGKCPVCRYTQTRSIKPSEEPSRISSCDFCGVGAANQSLWMCLLCGHVGCSRYAGGHAAAHYEASAHCYAIELDTQRVWSYIDDSYVHRLIQNKADGKLVELPSRHPEPEHLLTGVTAGGPNRAARAAQEKAEAIGLEYQHLLAGQLASQRVYYSDIVAKLKEEIGGIEIRAQQEKMRLEARALRADKAVELTRALQQELASERAMTKGLVSNLEQSREENRRAREETAAVRAEVAELQEQLRDLMFALSAGDKIQQSAPELSGGSLITKTLHKDHKKR